MISTRATSRALLVLALLAACSLDDGTAEGPPLVEISTWDRDELRELGIEPLPYHIHFGEQMIEARLFGEGTSPTPRKLVVLADGSHPKTIDLPFRECERSGIVIEPVPGAKWGLILVSVFCNRGEDLFTQSIHYTAMETYFPGISWHGAGERKVYMDGLCQRSDLVEAKLTSRGELLIERVYNATITPSDEFEHAPPSELRRSMGEYCDEHPQKRETIERIDLRNRQ